MPLHPVFQGFADAGAQLPPMEMFTAVPVRAGDDDRSDEALAAASDTLTSSL